jgi:hypothetical protein
MKLPLHIQYDFIMWWMKRDNFSFKVDALRDVNSNSFSKWLFLVHLSYMLVFLFDLLPSFCVTVISVDHTDMWTIYEPVKTYRKSYKMSITALQQAELWM